MSRWADPGVRRVVSWAAIGLAAVWAVLGVVEAFTADPTEGEGWGGGVALVLLAAGPLLAVGLGLRSTSPGAVRATAVASAVLLALVAFVLVMQVLDPVEDTVRAVLVQVPVMAVYLAALLVELAAARGRRSV